MGTLMNNAEFNDTFSVAKSVKGRRANDWNVFATRYYIVKARYKIVSFVDYKRFHVDWELFKDIFDRR